jgi:large subunit ribosomal protein L10
MARPEKVQEVEELADRFSRSSIAVVTDYRGLNVSDMVAFRARLREAGIEYRVSKNTLARFAADKSGREVIKEDLVGPTAIAFAYDDPVPAAKIVSEFARTSRILQVKGALLGDRRIGAAEVTRLAELPSREVLIAQVLGGMKGPIAGLVNVLNGVTQNLVGVLDARRRQLEEGGSA